MANGGQDSGLACPDPIACGGTDQPPCDWATAQKPATWCRNPPQATIFVRDCDGGYSALITFTFNSSAIYYYQGNAIVAEVIQPTAGPDVCFQGPAVFVPPTCGDFVRLCPTDVDAGSELPVTCGNIVCQPNETCNIYQICCPPNGDCVPVSPPDAGGD
jgi:hypothetical protein